MYVNFPCYPLARFILFRLGRHPFDVPESGLASLRAAVLNVPLLFRYVLYAIPLLVVRLRRQTLLTVNWPRYPKFPFAMLFPGSVPRALLLQIQPERIDFHMYGVLPPHDTALRYAANGAVYPQSVYSKPLYGAVSGLFLLISPFVLASFEGPPPGPTRPV